MPNSSPSRFSAPTRAAILGFCGEGKLPRDRDLEREFVDHFVTILGNDKSVAEKNAEHAIGGDRVGVGHYHHARLWDPLQFFRRDLFGDPVRLFRVKKAGGTLGPPGLVCPWRGKF